jgi:uncharacterized protein DUF3999
VTSPLAGGLALALLGTAVSVAAAPPAGPAWTFVKPIAAPALGAPAYVEAPLDAEVYREAAADLRDLRVRDGAGGEIAFVLRRHEKPATWQEREVALRDLGRTPGGQVRFVLDLGREPGLHNRVRLRLADAVRNVRVPVSVETGTDGRTWQLVRLAGFVYVVEGETRAADTTVSYPASTACYLRVTMVAPPGPVLPVTGAAVITETAAVRDEEPLPATLIDRAEDAARRRTELVVDLGGRRPVDRVELDVGDSTFYRVALVEARDGDEGWRFVASGALSAIDSPRRRERQTTLAFPETATRFLRVVIRNEDDRPLRVSAIRLAAVRRGVVFSATPGQRYTLDYGDPARAVPRYDLAHTFPYVAPDALPVATLGVASRVPVPPPRKAWTEERPYLLWGAMAIVAVGLGGLLVRLGRGVRPVGDARDDTPR